SRAPVGVSVLARSHAAVGACSAAGVEEREWGTGSGERRFRATVSPTAMPTSRQGRPPSRTIVPHSLFPIPALLRQKARLKPLPQHSGHPMVPGRPLPEHLFRVDDVHALHLP